MFKKLAKVLTYTVTIIIIFFIGADLLLSDFGPGETSTSRLEVIGAYIVVSVGVLYFLRKLWRKS